MLEEETVTKLLAEFTRYQEVSLEQARQNQVLAVKHAANRERAHSARAERLQRPYPDSAAATSKTSRAPTTTLQVSGGAPRSALPTNEELLIDSFLFGPSREFGVPDRALDRMLARTRADSGAPLPQRARGDSATPLPHTRSATAPRIASSGLAHDSSSAADDVVVAPVAVDGTTKSAAPSTTTVIPSFAISESEPPATTAPVTAVATPPRAPATSETTISVLISPALLTVLEQLHQLHQSKPTPEAAREALPAIMAPVTQLIRRAQATAATQPPGARRRALLDASASVAAALSTLALACASGAPPGSSGADIDAACTFM